MSPTRNTLTTFRRDDEKLGRLALEMLCDRQRREAALKSELPDAHAELLEHGLLSAAGLEQLPTLERLANGREAAPVGRYVGRHMQDREPSSREQGHPESMREGALVGGRELGSVHDRSNERTVRQRLRLRRAPLRNTADYL